MDSECRDAYGWTTGALWAKYSPHQAPEIKDRFDQGIYLLKDLPTQRVCGAVVPNRWRTEGKEPVSPHEGVPNPNLHLFRQRCGPQPCGFYMRPWGDCAVCD